MPAQIRESTIPRRYDRANYNVKAVGFIIKNWWQLAGGSRPQRAAAIVTGKMKPGPRPPIATISELVDLEEAMVILRLMKPALAEVVDTFIDSGCSMTVTVRVLRRNYKTLWSQLGRAYEWLSEFM